MSLQNLKTQANKKAGENVIAMGDEILEIERIQTGSLSLDLETGGGVPEERITCIVGKWSSGKTSVTLKIAAQYAIKYPERPIVWIDAEGVWDPLWARRMGLDPTKVFLVRPQYAEQAYDIALKAIDEGAGLIVIDSIAALAAKAEMEGTMEDIQVAAMARINGKFMRKIGNVAKTGTSETGPTLIYLNQYRQNVGGYGAPTVEPGGEAITTFMPSLKIVLSLGELTDGKKVYKSVKADDEGLETKGQKVKFFTEKNKTAPWKRRGHFWFFFDDVPELGIKKGTYDRMDEIIRYTDKYGIVNQRGSAYDLIRPETGELVQTFKGKANVAAFIRENPDVREWVEKAVMSKVLKEMAGDETEEERPNTVQEERPVQRFDEISFDEEEGSESSEEPRSKAAASVGSDSLA